MTHVACVDGMRTKNTFSKRGKKLLRLTGAGLAVLCTVTMQKASAEPEVRRAIPVEKPAATPKPEPPTAPAVPFDNPAWMNRVPAPKTPPPEAPIPRAEPVATPYRPQKKIEVAPTPSPAPVATPTPAAMPAPAAAPAEIPAPAAVPAGSGAPTPAQPQKDEDGTIRIAPSAGTASAEDLQLEKANAVYTRKMYDFASMEYEKYLISFPNAKGRDMARFRLAECHRMLGNDAAARTEYEKLIAEFREGEFAGAGAYRLGEYLYAEKKYEPSLAMFEIAGKNAASAEVRLSAKYNSARCLERLNRSQDAIPLYKEIVGDPDPTYRDYATLALADAEAAGGRKEEALRQYMALASAGGKSVVRPEAAVKAAALAAEMNKPDEATKLFKQALALPDVGDWKPAAVVGLLRIYFQTGNFQDVSAMPWKELKTLPAESQAEAFVIVANAERKLGNLRAARAAYEKVMLEFPNSQAAAGAKFQRLANLYQMNDETVLAEVDKFLNTTTDPAERNQARLMKAETLFKMEDFTSAAKLYEALRSEELSDDYKRELLFKLGWCYGQTDNAEAGVRIFSEYLDKYPREKAATAALLQRGLLKTKRKDYAGALADYDALIKDHREAGEREAALQNKALILGQQQEYKGMTEAFETLLKDYPETKAAGQANFWIGWAAFENKDYMNAAKYFAAARKIDAKGYGERSSLRIMLCYYYLGDWDGLAQEADSIKGFNPPPEILQRLGEHSFEKKNYRAAERYFLALSQSNLPSANDAFLMVAESKIKLKEFAEAKPAAEKALEVSREPARRARALLALAEIERHAGSFDEAQKRVEEALLLQPEGRYNAEGRLLIGDIEESRGNYDAAARAFMTAAVLYDDPEITPRALKRAANAYRLSNNLIEAQKAEAELKQKYPDFEGSPKISREGR